MTLTRQTFARHTPSAKEQSKEHSLALLTHLTYYLCGRPKMNNSYYFKIIVIYISKLFYKILWAKFEARTDDSTISAHTQPAPRTIYLLFLTQFVVRVCVGTFFAGMVECWLFFLLLSHGIVSTDLDDTSMVVKRRFSSEVAVKFSRKDPIFGLVNLSRNNYWSAARFGPGDQFRRAITGPPAP